MRIEAVIGEGRIFVDLGLGLVVFDLGRRMDLQWMKRDWTLAVSGLAESLLSFGAVFATLMAFDFTAVKAGIAASLALPTSPAVVLPIPPGTRSEGRGTARPLTLAPVNTLRAPTLPT